jgi:hypothetical protein
VPEAGSTSSAIPLSTTVYTLHDGLLLPPACLISSHLAWALLLLLLLLLSQCLITVCVQAAALIYYVASYVPYARKLLRVTCKKCVNHYT